MGSDIRDRLKDAALEPSFDVDVDDLHQRARLTRLRHVGATAAISLVALVAGAALAVSTFTPDLQPPVVGFGEEEERTESNDVDEQYQAEQLERLEEARRHADELRREAEREAAAERAPQPHDDWMTDEQKEGWEAEHGETQWIVGYFFPPDFQYEGDVTFEGLEARWQPAPDDEDLDREELLRRSLSALAEASPPDLLHPLEQSNVGGTPWPEQSESDRTIALERATLDGTRLVLDFAPGPWVTGAAAGTTGETMMLIQLMAAAAHHYPAADELCILVDGEESYLFSHGIVSCPHDLP